MLYARSKTVLVTACTAVSSVSLTWVVTVMSPCTKVFALGWLCTTGDGWVQDSEPTVAGQLIKTYKKG